MVRHIKYHMTRKVGADALAEQCIHCDKAFMTKQQLTRHLAAHKELRPFKCEQCDKKFKTADSVKRHVYVHSDARPFSCRICNKDFKAKHLMKKHEETHSDEKNYECPKCGKKFKARNSLRDHLLVHNGTRPYKCDQCDQAFYRRSHLATHKIVHSEVKPFSCAVCGKSFGRREHLKVHERIHSGEKPFKCNQCERSFNQQAGLQAHLVSHSDDRPYTCLTCKKTFKYQSQVKHHACKRDEIGPCMVDVHGGCTVDTGSPSPEPITALGTPETACQERQENETRHSTAEISNVTSPSELEDTVILIQIENRPHTDEAAVSVDIATSQEGNTNRGTNSGVVKRNNPGTHAKVSTSEEEANSDGNASNIQRICESRDITRTSKGRFGNNETATNARISCEGVHPNTTNSQTRFVSSPCNVTGANIDIFETRANITETQTSREERHTNYSVHTRTKFSSASGNMTRTNVDFPESHGRISEPRMSNHGRYANATNTAARHASGQVYSHYNSATERGNTETFVAETQMHPVVNEAFITTSQGLSLGEQRFNSSHETNLVWSHDGISSLVGNVQTTEQNTTRIVAEQFHQPVSSLARRADTTERNHSMLSGLSHRWNPR